MKVQGMSLSLGWDWRFKPFAGAFKTDKTWILEVAEGCVRIGTDANPSRAGVMDYTPWTNMDKRKSGTVESPVVMIRLDLSALAARLA